MNVTFPEQEELPGYVGLAIGGVIFGIGAPGAVSGAGIAQPFLVAGGLLGLVSIAYLVVLLRVSSATIG